MAEQKSDEQAPGEAPSATPGAGPPPAPGERPSPAPREAPSAAPARKRRPAGQAPKSEPAAVGDPGEAAANIARAAADIHRPAPARKRATRSPAERVALDYFQAIRAHDLERAVGLWAPGGRENVRGQIDGLAPETLREFIGGLLQAIPDLQMQILSTTAQGDRCAVQWRFTGTFAGSGRLNGIAPTGHPVAMEGIDLLRVSDGLIQSNDTYCDSLTLIRQIGMMPARGSTAEQRITGAFNAKTRLTARLQGEAMQIATGVWVVQGHPGRCNVYLIENGPPEGGVTLYDAGARTMIRAVAAAGARLGGIRRIILGHAHTAHRGSAPALGRPVLCHPDEVPDAEGSGGLRYWPRGLRGLPVPQRQAHRLLHRLAWDGGPVKISQTLSDGDEGPGGFQVIHLPGHAPGLIGLWRPSDRLALVSDCFETIDLWGRHRPAHVPEPTYSYDTSQARESILKLAALQPAAAWPGHGRPLTGDVRAQLIQVAGRE